VRDAVGSGNAWALSWQYPDLFGTQEANEAVRREVVDFLDMWSLIEFSYKCLSPTDKEHVAEAGPLGRNVQFYGFDVNSESEYLDVARFVIDQFDRFSEFRGRTLNAPISTVRDGAYTAIVIMHKMKNGTFVIERVVRGRWGVLERGHQRKLERQLEVHGRHRGRTRQWRQGIGGSNDP
jgi:YfbU domain